MRALLMLGVCVGTLTLAGCNHSAETMVGADPQLAKETLITALDAWKSGDAASLVKRAPSIRFTDDDYLSGAKLIDYDFEEPDAPILPFRNVRMELVLQDHQGQPKHKNVTYQVGVEPSLTVLRSDH